MARRKRTWTDVRQEAGQAGLFLLVLSIRATKDLLVFGAMWGSLFLAQLIKHGVPVSGWAAEWLGNAHTIGIAVAYGVLCVLLVWDIIEMSRTYEEN